MKHNSLRPQLVSIALLFFFSPFVAQAASDANISSVSIAFDTTATSAAATQTWTFTTSNQLASGTLLTFAMNIQGSTDPATSGFLYASNASFSSSTVQGTFALSSQGAAIGVITLSSTLAAGTHTFTIAVTNTATAGTYYAVIKSTNENNFTLSTASVAMAGGTSSSATQGLSSVSLTSSSDDVGATAQYDITFVTNRTLEKGEKINFYVDKEEGGGPDVAGFSLPTASFSSTSIQGTLAIQGNTLAAITLSSSLAAGTHAIRMDVKNSSTVGSYVLRASTGEIGGSIAAVSSSIFAMSEASSETESSEEESSETEQPTTLSTPENLKAKKISSRSAKLRWSAVHDATFYRLKIVTTSGKKVKTFRELTNTQKKLNKKLLKAGRTYKFRVTACNAAGCSKASAFVRFQMKDKK